MAGFEAEAEAPTPGGTPPATALSPGDRLLGFEITAVLGRGAFAVTYAARELATARAVAVKTAEPPGLAAADRATMNACYDSLRREAGILQKLNHPNIVRLLSLEEDQGRPLLILEPVDGPALLNAFGDGGRRADEERLRALLLPLADALAYLHRASILHRDIKPANIRLRSDGTPVLMDFGAAQMMTPSAAPTSRISEATAGYAAIEQYEENGQEGPFSDIYALAATAYRLISGVTPPDSRERAMGAQTLVPAVDVGRGRLPHDLLVAIDWGLSLTAESRPRSAQVWAEALSGPLTARQPGGDAAASDAAMERGDTTPAAEAVPGPFDDLPPTERIERRPLQVRRPPNFDLTGASRAIDQQEAAGARPNRSGLRWGMAGIVVLIVLVVGGLGAWEWYLLQVKDQWTVDPAGGGDTLSITEAMSRARDDATILVGPGTYEEALVMSRPLNLIAVSGDPADTVISTKGEPCLDARAAGGSATGFTFLLAPGAGGSNTACLDLSGRDLLIADSVVVSEAGPAIRVTGGGNVTIRGNRLGAKGVPALVIEAGSRGEFLDNRVEDGAKTGIVVRDGAAPVVMGNRVEGAEQAGVLIERGAKGRFEENEVLGSGASGIEVRGGADPLVARNRVVKSAHAGVFVYSGAKGRLEENVVVESGFSGIVITGGGAPAIRRNEIRENGEHGVMILKAGAGTVEDNVIEDNKGHGIALEAGTGAKIGENKVKANKAPQVQTGRIAAR